ncbi:hypothetical protein [Mycobacterium sp. 1423905.2]|uniref:CDGP domain-containing protein n=1 Tax=Mycobacterium sp. 1423905.2 TaxID=1856859 RepID=UPI000800CC66|nr:hypothetical protein [Mycobacterium sp. 1423905.2]OBJ53081.1 hypothetical protein A9W95_01645 [Mycobacterium sp. 1423905.2]
MRRSIVGGRAAALTAGGLIALAPPPQAGCQYGMPGVVGKCDGPIQPYGTWERCVTIARLAPNGASSFLMPEKHCEVVGPDQPSGDPNFADPRRTSTVERGT